MRTRPLRAALDTDGSFTAAVGARIADLRRRRGIKPAKLAQLSGVAASCISHIERGIRLPSVPTLLALVRVLDSTTDAVLGHEQIRKARP